MGNMRSVTKLTRTLADAGAGADAKGRSSLVQSSCDRQVTTDADRNLENLVTEEDVLGYDELRVCLKALQLQSDGM